MQKLHKILKAPLHFQTTFYPIIRVKSLLRIHRGTVFIINVIPLTIIYKSLVRQQSYMLIT